MNAKAHLDVLDETNKTALHLAAVPSGHLDVIKLLVEAKSNINIREAEGRTPLYGAAACGNYEAAELLTNARADINIPSNNGDTPLKIARRDQLTKTAKALRAAQFLRKLQAKEESKALQLQEEANAKEAVKHQKELDAIKKKAAISERAQQEEPAKQAIESELTEKLANKEGCIELLKALIHNDILADITSGLRLKVSSGNVKASTIFKALKGIFAKDAEAAAGANLVGLSQILNTVIDQDNNTLLHKAAFHGKTDLALALTDNGANVDAQNIEGYTPGVFNKLCQT